MNLRQIILFIALSIGLAPAIGHKSEPPPVGASLCHINDFSNLNHTVVEAIVAPSSYEELQAIVEHAKKNSLKLSIAGSKHSQGGHAFYSDAIVISLKNLNKVLAFDAEKNTLTVQTGATWHELQLFLNPHNKAIKIMQFASVFTIGGALSVNANGIDPNCGPLIESVRSIRILKADGTIVQASRQNNAKLFHLAIGGYGLFGIILDATFDIVDNALYKLKIEKYSLSDYVNFIKNRKHQDPTLGFHFACLGFNAFGEKLFSDVRALNFRLMDENELSQKTIIKKRKMHKERFVGIKREIIKLLAGTRWMKALYSSPNGHEFGKIASRNNIMNPPVSHSHTLMKNSTNMLHEFFIPVENLVSFIDVLESITKELDQNLMYVAFRFIPKNTESFLSYTQTDRIGVVLFFNQKFDDPHDTSRQWTQRLINTAIHLGGTYYLPAPLYADKEQVQKAHPHIIEFFKLKKQYDPQELFMNCFYKKYA